MNENESTVGMFEEESAKGECIENHAEENFNIKNKAEDENESAINAAT